MTKIGHAAWLSWSHRSRVYNHLSREYSFVSLIYQCCPIYIYGKRLLIPTVGDVHSIHSSEMSGRSCVAELQDILVELQCIVPRVHWSEGGSIPCHSWKSLTQYVLAVLIVYYICGTWDANIPLDCYLLDLDIIIISKEFWYKDYSSFQRDFES